jgi:hypothetical protein
MMSILRRLLSVRVAIAEANPHEIFLLDALLQASLQTQLASLQEAVRERTPDNPAADGFKAYSQADEDGIIEVIMERLGICEGRFLEIGTGDGRENNTHYLLLKGWRGAWIDGDQVSIDRARASLGGSLGRLALCCAMVNRGNILEVASGALGEVGVEGGLDFLSIDIDGNDLQVCLPLLAAYSPRVVCAEYNAKLRPPLEISVAYDENHVWTGDDYQGSSLSAWSGALKGKYLLVACSLSGSNAFFVRTDLANGFSRYTERELYQPARYHLTALRSGHPPSTSFLRSELDASPPMEKRL